MNLKSVAAALLLSLFASFAYAQQPAQTVVKPGKQIDSMLNGFLIGAAAGAAGAWMFTRANCGRNDPECTANVAPIGVAVFVPGGMAAGMIIDRLINKTLPPGANAHATIGPMIAQRGGKKGAGIALNLKIRF